MEEFVIDHPRNEASGLLGMQNRSILAALGWDAGFWIVCDEAPGEEALAALGRPSGGEWEVVRLRSRARWPGRSKRTEDSETLARAGSWVYVFGSQFGTKDGTLQPRRHFVARFNEALVTARKGRLRARVELRRRPFLLHRLVNDALRAANVEVRGAASKAHARFVAPALERGTKRGKRWAERLRPDDAPINVEGATFLPGGHLLLGLRYPVTAEGHPILVELEGIDRYFEDGGTPDPEVVAVRVVTSIGSRDAPAGVRELDSLGADVHLVTGDLDSKPEESALLAGDPQAAGAPNEHWTVPLALGVDGPAELTGRRVRRFDEDASVEGLALAADEIWYAHDDDRIRLEVAQGAGGPGSWNGAAAPDAT